MKKITQIITVITFALVTLSSCSSSIESDAQKVADIQCKVQKLINNPSALEKSQKLMNEIKVLTQKMQGKYSSFEDKQKFAEALSKAKANCN